MNRLLLQLIRLEIFLGAIEQVRRCAQISTDAIRSLLAEFGLSLIELGEKEPIPGSFWGEPEAGVIGNRVFVRSDTPVHSLLHEACHLIVLPEHRRQHLHTDASDSQREEDATCYLQLLLADQIPGFGKEQAFRDMDTWGYSFRLGSARAWFENDAEDACIFLHERGLAYLFHENGSCNMIVSSRSAPVATSANGQPDNSSIARKYARAAAGSLTNSRIPAVGSSQPGNSK